MPILCYEITATTGPNLRSTTGAMEGHLGAVLKANHEDAQAQVYAELAANRLAMFLGIPVAVGVAARNAASCDDMRFASLRASETGLGMYDFTQDDQDHLNNEPEEEFSLPDGIYRGAGHLRPMTKLAEKYPAEVAAVAVFDLWIGNDDRPLNFKAALSPGSRGIMFALDQGKSLLACRPTVDESLMWLHRGDFPAAHPFQKLVNPYYCGAMAERIASMPEWAIYAATVYDDTIGNVTIDEQAAVHSALVVRKGFLRNLVNNVLL